MDKLVLTLIILIINFSCAKKSINTTNTDNDIQLECYKSLISSIENKDCFIFFTDPHIPDINNTEHLRYINNIEDVYNSGYFDFCICGGDWLTAHDTKEEAIIRLSRITSYTDSVFKQFYPILGNHDTNYQGKLFEQSEPYTGTLSYDEICRVMFKGFGSTYYSFNTPHSTFFVFDSGIDWVGGMNDFRWEQVDWFCRNLLTINKHHIIVGIHIYASNKFSKPQELAISILNVSNVFNKKGHIQVKNKTYDFSNTIGKVSCILTGHAHIDTVDTSNSIPIICTTHLKDNDESSFDMVVLDWDDNLYRSVRVGHGYDRIVSLAK